MTCDRVFLLSEFISRCALISVFQTKRVQNSRRVPYTSLVVVAESYQFHSCDCTRSTQLLALPSGTCLIEIILGDRCARGRWDIGGLRRRKMVSTKLLSRLFRHPLFNHDADEFPLRNSDSDVPH